MTPRELAAARVGAAPAQATSFERGALARLMRDFPDEEMNHG
jgi:hypothetical protein